MTVKHIADKCPQLDFLDVSFCPLMTEDIINILSKLRHLEELRLDSQKFSFINMSRFELLKHRHILYLSTNTYDSEAYI
jgi:hypothetical protein